MPAFLPAARPRASATARALALAVALGTGLSVTLPAQAANHYVRADATGRQTGENWTDAWPSLPAHLVRGDTYYLAGGRYGSHAFDDPPAGGRLIVIKRATRLDHGTDAGWSPAYDQGPAVFTHWEILGDDYVFDGQRRDADWKRGATAGYGLRVAGASPVRLDDGNGRGGDRLTFRFVDLVGGGRDTGHHDDVVHGLAGNTDITFQYCALHDSDRTIFLMRGPWERLVVDHSYLARNASTPGEHGEMLSMTDSSDVTFSNDVMEDIEGTAVIAGLNGGTASHWRIFGNTVLHTAAYRADIGRRKGHTWGIAGFVNIANDKTNRNVGNDIQVINNTFVNVQGTWSGVVIDIGRDNVVRNNLWYDSVRTGNFFTGVASHNWYYRTVADGDTGATRTVCESDCDVFVDLAGRDFRLRRSLTPGLPLGSAVAIDGDGVTRAINGTWDRGAYQFPGRALSPASRPGGLVVH